MRIRGRTAAEIDCVSCPEWTLEIRSGTKRETRKLPARVKAHLMVRSKCAFSCGKRAKSVEKMAENDDHSVTFGKNFSNQSF
jgi:hypothetical protein